MKMRRPSFTSWINLRTLVLFLGLYCFLTPQKPAFLAWLDHIIFDSGVALMNPQFGELSLAVVELPEAELRALNSKLSDAGQTLQLVQRLLDSGSTVGLVLKNEIQLSQGWDSTLVEELQRQEKIPSEVNAIVQPYLTAQNHWEKIFENSSFVIGNFHSISGNRNHVSTSNVPVEPTSDWLYWIPEFLVPSLPEGGAADTILSNQRNAMFSIFPATDVKASNEPHYPLLWEYSESVGSDFVLEIYRRLMNSPDVVWRQYQSAEFSNGIALELSLNGYIFPFYNRWSTDPPGLQSLTLEQALASLPEDNIVLLGADRDQLQRLAKVLLSLEHLNYFKRPAWVWAVEKIVLVLIFVYLIFVIPRLAIFSGVLASALLMVVMVVMQTGWQITQWVWIPMGSLIQFLVTGQVLILLWKNRRDQLLNIQAKAHGALYQLGLQLFRDGRSDDALLAIRECVVSDAVAQLMYDIAAQQERKRQYSEAIKTYQQLNSQKKQFRDVGEKIEKLIAFSSGTAGYLSTEADVSKTLIVSETTINKPVLGRYEIERELGRGAMGVVYLGRDPKISRQVAIKTLSYSNLDSQQLDEFKQRFFREAEAAGRLSHPNIVTIYDVGEEYDLAFIAMDFIQGQALNAFVSADSLLLVPDVYQIVIEVAEGLSYAHEKNIIHRDIKPGNIMYQPDNQTVKITDFGVARIVDSARTNTGDILGSPLYMSPEQLKGEKVTAQTDIYSLGVTLYQLLSGEVPFTGDGIASLSYNIIHEKHKGIREWRPDLPSSATRIINKALNKDPGKRYKKASELADALRKSLRDDFQ